jgi:hypothetical protein
MKISPDVWIQVPWNPNSTRWSAFRQQEEVSMPNLSRFTFTNKLYWDDKLLLAFDALVLSEMLCCDVSCGKIVHGDDHARRKMQTAPLEGKVRKIIGKIAKLLASHSPPDLVLNCSVRPTIEQHFIRPFNKSDGSDRFAAVCRGRRI